MRILITGAGGFAGRHLAEYLSAHVPDAALYGTTVNATSDAFPVGVMPHTVDLRDPAATRDLIASLHPTQIYHLAGSALVRNSFDTAWETLETNLRATLNVIQACIDAEIAPRVLVVTSGDIYGELPANDNDSENQACADESASLNPTSPYAVSKIAQDFLIVPYVRRYGLPIIRARAFNHIGRGQRIGFAIPDFASKIAMIEQELIEPILTCKNIQAERDFTDVRDMVRAYALLMERGIAGETYNIATGRLVPLRTVLDILIANSTYSGRIEIQPSGDQRVDRLCGDPSKLRALTGWTPEIALEVTLRDVLDDWRTRVAAELRTNRT